MRSVSLLALSTVLVLGGRLCGQVSSAPCFEHALGTLIGRSFDGTVLPLVGGFAGLGLAALAMMRWAEAPTRPR